MRVGVGNYKARGMRYDEVIHVDVDLSPVQVDLLRDVLERHGLGIDRTFSVEVNEGESIVEYECWDDKGKPYITDGTIARTLSVIPNA